MSWLFKQSIWAPNAIPISEWKYRNLKRVLFPIVDVFFILSGISAAYYGVPAISEFFPREVVDTFASLLSLSAIVALLGTIFPRLWGMQMVASSIILGLMVVYVTSLFILTRIGEGNRGFVLGISAVATAPIFWRISLLSNEWQERKILAKKLMESAEEAEGGTLA